MRSAERLTAWFFRSIERMTASGGGAVILNFLCFLCRLEAGICGARLNFRMVLI